MMRAIKPILAAALLLILAACGNNSNTFPEAAITSVTPAEVTAGAGITVTGSNYYAVTGAGNTRIEACGVTTSGSIVEPLTRSILLPPGSEITAEVGSTITGTLPEDGFTEGLSSVRVTRPDGSTAVLENAVTCVIPTPEPEPEPEPELPVAPDITSFTGPGTVDANAKANFTWDISYNGLDDLSCSFNPGDGSESVTHDCSAGHTTHTYEWAGTYTATLTVQDETHRPVNLTHDITVNATADAPVIDRWDFELAYNDPDGQIITADFDVRGRGATGPVTCSIDFGDNTEPLELGDDCVADTQHTIPYSDYDIGTYDATLTITDTHGNRVIDTIEVNVTNPDAPVITLFHSDNLATGEMRYVNFHLRFRTDPRLDDSLITCTLYPGVGGEASEPTCDPTDVNHFAYTYDSPGHYTATFTVEAPYNKSVTEEHDITVLPDPPVISYFTGPEITIVNEAITFTWEIYNPDNSNLTCSLNPGGELDTITLEDCNTGEHDVTYEETGEVTATFTVTDEYGREAEWTTNVEVVGRNASNLNITATGLPGDEEPEVTITGPHNYEEITGPGTITLPYAGDYTITAEERVEANVVIPGQHYTYTGAWEISTPTVTITTDGSAKYAAFQYIPVLTNVRFALGSLPDGYNIYHQDVKITMERVNDQDGSYGPPVRVTTRPFQTEPGLYHIAFNDVTTTVDRADWSWQENYLAPNTTIFTINHGGLTGTPTYTLETAELTANASGLPSGLIPELTLRHLTALDQDQPEVPAAQWSALAPGAYRLEPDVLVDPVPIPPDFDAAEVHHPVSGDSNAVYEASSSTITLNSGDDETVQMDYSVKAGLIQVNISAPDGSNEPVTGDVTVLNVSGDEIANFAEGTSGVNVTPGVYEIQIKDVEPEGDSPGYTVRGGSQQGYYVVPSYSIMQGTHPVQINVTYEPTTP